MLVSREKCLAPLSALLITLLVLPLGCSTSRTSVIDGSRIAVVDTTSAAVDVEEVYTAKRESVAVRDCKLRGKSLRCLDSTTDTKKVKFHLQEIDSIRTALGQVHQLWAPSESKLKRVYSGGQTYRKILSPKILNDTLSFYIPHHLKSNRGPQWIDSIEVKSIAVGAIDSVEVSVKRFSAAKTVVVSFGFPSVLACLILWIENPYDSMR
jgi:hypothetical protein